MTANKRPLSVAEATFQRLLTESPRHPLPEVGGLMHITPAMAADWLRRNLKNLPLRPANLEKLRREIREDRWRVNGQTISFKKNGELNDGQHRLLACVLEDVAIDSYVVLGIDDDAFVTVDTGRVREAKDILPMLGYKNSNILAAAVRWCILYDADAINAGSSWKTSNKRMAKASNEEIISYVERHQDLAQATTLFGADTRLSRLAPPSVAAFVAFKVREIAPEKAGQFLNDLTTGENLIAGSPIYLLRERLIKERGEFRKLPHTHLLAYMIKTWNLYVAGETKALSFDPSKERFPRFRVPGEPAQARRKTETAKKETATCST